MLLRLRLAVWIIGMLCGIAIMLTGATLNFWLAKEGLTPEQLGMFSLVALPYSINFIWTPILDRHRLPLLGDIFGQRIAWIVLTQLFLAINIIILGYICPKQNLLLFAFCAFLAAFFSSTNDSLMGAVRSQLFNAKQQGSISGVYVIGYRIGMMLAGSGLIYLSLFMPWSEIYKLVGMLFMVVPFILAFLLKSVSSKPYEAQEENMVAVFEMKDICKPFGSYLFVVQILILLILYRLADNFINTMINPFLLDLKFQDFDIATVGKLCGSIGAIIGAIISGRMIKRLDIVKALLLFGAIHSAMHLLLAGQALIGNNLAFYFVTSISESVTGGMAMTAYIAFIASICKGKYLATQQALFNSMMGASRSILPSISGLVVSYFGWFNFFIFAFLSSLPALIMLHFMSKRLTQHIKK